MEICILDKKIQTIVEEKEHSIYIYLSNEGFDHAETNEILLNDFIDKNYNVIQTLIAELYNKVLSSKYKNSFLSDVFKIEDDISFLNISLLNEKSNLYKSKHINDLIKFLALKLFCEKNDVKIIDYKSENIYIGQFLSVFTKKNKIFFKNFNLKAGKLKFEFFRILYPFNSIYWLFKFFLRSFQFKAINDSSQIIDYRPSVNLVTYSDNIHFDRNSIESAYWGELPKLIEDLDLRVDWLFIDEDSIKNINKLKSSILNSVTNTKLNQNILFLSGLLDFKIIFKSIYNWIYMKIKFMSLKKGDLWREIPEYKDFYIYELKRSIFSTESLKNLIFFNLFKKYSKNERSAVLDLFLYEGQSWEKSFVYNQKKSHKKYQVYGVVHNSIRKWDLRLIDIAFSKFYKTKRNQADGIISNSLTSFKYLSKYSDIEIIACEALRYPIKKQVSSNKNYSYDSLLVIGDYIKESTLQLIKMLNNNKDFINFFKNSSIKFHPNNNLSNLLEDRKIKIIKGNLLDALHKFDVVISTQYTSATEDVILAGKPVFVIKDSNMFNLNFNENIKGINLVKNVDEIKNKLIDNAIYYPDNIKNPIFFNDKNLKNWRSFLKNAS